MSSIALPILVPERRPLPMASPSSPVPISPSTPISPSSSLARRRISVSTASSTKTSRRSSLMHEIQPPARRLSAHQVLLLTPFGGTVPLEPPAMGREASSLGSSLPRLSSIRPVSTAGLELSLAARPALAPRSTYEPPPALRGPRTRHSLTTLPVAPSPLSQPLATIPSDSTASTAVSREPSGDESVAELVAVPMTRSNSLPVLTLRELDAMKEKDTELGIARGGDWAWVGRDDEDDMETPGLSDTSTMSSTPPSFPFSDPFVQQGTYRRTEETARFGDYRPVATAEGYQYSPSSQRDRRVSDVPPKSPDPHSTPRPGPSSGLESPRGTRAPAHQRPKITRYKTSPALSEGLGLSVVVRPEKPGVQVDVDAGGSLGRKGKRINLSTVERREQRHAQLRDGGEFGERRGSWTPVDVVDGLELARSSISSSTSGFSFARGLSISSSTSSRHILLATRAMSLSEFGVGRSRTGSFDPAATFDKVDAPPRRGSSGMQALGLWRKRADKERDVGKGHWQDRRGSWAEGWKKD